MRKALLLILAPALLAACGSPGSAASPGGYGAPTPAATSTESPASVPTPTAAPATAAPSVAPTILVAHNVSLGAILVNPQGRTLYYFIPERGGSIVCTGQCTSVWPPSFTAGSSAPAAAGVSGQLGVVARAGGEQITYNRWPLYTFAGDMQAGQTNGQGVFGFGGKWFVATPNLQP
jgi:predicted lipoprotein with Yx(FWY)xxD motif